jgi:hypothetical protein
MVSDLPFHHWEPSEEHPNEEGEYPRVVSKIEAACATSGIPFDRLHLQYTDGGVAVSAGYSSNHPDGAPETHRKFLRELARIAPVTYGMIHMQDTDRWVSNGEFTVLKLANGTVSESKELLVQPSPDQ